MSLPHALLGLLNYLPATGYQLKATFSKSIHFFWNATLPQIYRTLKQMEAKGWLTVTVEHQDGKPSRKVYRITDDGQKELRRWLTEPTEIPEPRNAMLIKIFFGNQMDPNHFANHLKKWHEYHADLIKRYEKEIIPLVQHYATATGASRDASYWDLTLDYGRRHARMVLDWCDTALRQIKDKGREKSLQKESAYRPRNLRKGTRLAKKI